MSKLTRIRERLANHKAAAENLRADCFHLDAEVTEALRPFPSNDGPTQTEREIRHVVAMCDSALRNTSDLFDRGVARVDDAIADELEVPRFCGEKCQVADAVMRGLRQRPDPKERPVKATESDCPVCHSAPGSHRGICPRGPGVAEERRAKLEALMNELEASGEWHYSTEHGWEKCEPKPSDPNIAFMCSYEGADENLPCLGKPCPHIGRYCVLSYYSMPQTTRDQHEFTVDEINSSEVGFAGYGLRRRKAPRCGNCEALVDRGVEYCVSCLEAMVEEQKHPDDEAVLVRPENCTIRETCSRPITECGHAFCLTYMVRRKGVRSTEKAQACYTSPTPDRGDRTWKCDEHGVDGRYSPSDDPCCFHAVNERGEHPTAVPIKFMGGDFDRPLTCVRRDRCVWDEGYCDTRGQPESRCFQYQIRPRDETTDLQLPRGAGMSRASVPRGWPTRYRVDR